MSSGDTPTNVTEKGRVPGILYHEGGRGREEQGGREVEGEGGGGGERRKETFTPYSRFSRGCCMLEGRSGL